MSQAYDKIRFSLDWGEITIPEPDISPDEKSFLRIRRWNGCFRAHLTAGTVHISEVVDVLR